MTNPKSGPSILVHNSASRHVLINVMQLKKRFTLLTVEQKDKVLKDIKNINELQPYKNLDYKLNQQITL